MKILVCIKQVPDDDIAVVPDESGTCWRAAEGADWRINRYDEHALEEALRIREAMPGTRIDTVSAGPPRVRAALRRALEMGADEGYHIRLDDDRNPMPSEISALLAAWAGGRGYDLILAGSLSEDDMHGQTGPMLAAHLDWPWATSAIRLDVGWEAQAGMEGPSIGVEREMEGGTREVLAIRLPALVAVQSGINRPRYPALSHVLRARSQGLTEIPADTLPAPQIRERSLRVSAPPPASCLFLEGTMEEKAGELLRILHDRSLL
ncbi:MAG: electron transfer flavoprotein subunit beta [Deltaproteobacteria bacterium HGW-Deltaproteobacteria-19]|jgi:electron transfer flavoprotein beta subunit|nr:MAG: electron transfer flavoprotein subunit beta [Deltaproteobacteria bacterium HGW-Deltaproteobacteria-19]